MQNIKQIFNAKINININTKQIIIIFCLLDANSCKILSLFLLIKEYTTIHRWGNTLLERNKINTRKRQQNTMKHMMVTASWDSGFFTYELQSVLMCHP